MLNQLGYFQQLKLWKKINKIQHNYFKLTLCNTLDSIIDHHFNTGFEDISCQPIDKKTNCIPHFSEF